MNLFETIKAAVPVRQAAEHYGLKVNRNGMACCPFHNDRHPSLKLNEEYFFCFGCGAAGDVVDFAAKLFDLGSLQAAQRLAADFGIFTGPGRAVPAPHKDWLRTSVSAPNKLKLWQLPTIQNILISVSSVKTKCCASVR